MLIVVERNHRTICLLLRCTDVEKNSIIQFFLLIKLNLVKYFLLIKKMDSILI